jgi:hypothetical protein
VRKTFSPVSFQDAKKSQAGMVVRVNFGAIEAFEKTPGGVRMFYTKNGARDVLRRRWWWWRSGGWPTQPA